MIFQEGAKKSIPSKFVLGDELISNTHEYCYLGIKLMSNSKFTLVHQQLSEKAMHALYTLRKHLDFNLWPPQLTTKIFDYIITPILLYNSEVSFAYLNNDFSKWDKLPTEKVHLRFCKMYLGVNSKAVNIACRRELGKLPLLINIHKRILKYVTHLNKLPQSSIAKQAFLISKELHNYGKVSFCSNVISLLKLYNCFDSLESLTNQSMPQLFNDIHNKYLNFWKHKLNNSSKLSYNKFKTEV